MLQQHFFHFAYTDICGLIPPFNGSKKNRRVEMNGGTLIGFSLRLFMIQLWAMGVAKLAVKRRGFFSQFSKWPTTNMTYASNWVSLFGVIGVPLSPHENQLTILVYTRFSSGQNKDNIFKSFFSLADIAKKQPRSRVGALQVGFVDQDQPVARSHRPQHESVSVFSQTSRRSPFVREIEEKAARVRSEETVPANRRNGPDLPQQRDSFKGPEAQEVRVRRQAKVINSLIGRKLLVVVWAD